MKADISKSEAKEKIDSFFKKEEFSAEEVKKIKRLAMKFKIRLGEYRKKFCKKCLFRLKGKTRISDENKSIVCENCGFVNKFKMNQKS
jgi:RNase P subunit RPR2